MMISTFIIAILFLLDPGVPGVQSMGPNVYPYKTLLNLCSYDSG